MGDRSDIFLPRGLELRHNEGGLALVHGDMVLRCDFTTMLPRLRQDRLAHELLVRAARVRGVERPSAVDATAGLGEDSLLLAAVGFEVTLVEHDPVIAALLRDGLERAANESQLEGIVCRMRLIEGDSVEVLAGLAEAPDVVYLDPMFPAKRKDAATKKKLQLFQMLERPCGNEDDLMHAALATRPRKVVVKRPLKGPNLAGLKPSSTFAGKVVRYDVYVPV
ncbi:MAG: class I SAM-dependent methyltransferase [Atopobiaceae bacterium]|nr:class I SAM-dependent methyltransferase [Atopobiaceae bacterium]